MGGHWARTIYCHRLEGEHRRQHSTDRKSEKNPAATIFFWNYGTGVCIGSSAPPLILLPPPRPTITTTCIPSPPSSSLLEAADNPPSLPPRPLSASQLLSDSPPPFCILSFLLHPILSPNSPLALVCILFTRSPRKTNIHFHQLLIPDSSRGRAPFPFQP